MFWQFQSVRHVQLMIGGEKKNLYSYNRDSQIIINFSTTEYEAYCILFNRNNPLYFDLI